MKAIGIICEYNPLHNGHHKQIRYLKDTYGDNCAVVCLMSGNFVQRGSPAIFDKSLRAKAAVLSGADLVLELPVTYALSSAEGFAAGGVRILSLLCDSLCFGSETGDGDILMDTAEALLSDRFSPLLHDKLATGKSFPAARQEALREMGMKEDILSRPNDILAVEYCKAILSTGASMKALPIKREGSYHAEIPEPENPSATAVRTLMLAGNDWHPYIPSAAASIFENAPLHSLTAGERAILGKLRTMTDDEFEALPYGSEGLWRKFMHESRSHATLEEILSATKSKRYTRSRLDRMMMCAFLGITAKMLEEPAPYTRILAFNHKGRSLLNRVKKTGQFLNAGESVDHPYWALEKRCGDLYGLFQVSGIAPPAPEENRRVYYRKEGL